MKIFISYSSEKHQDAEKLCISLQQDGHDVFFDKLTLPKGNSYDNLIRKELLKSKLLIFLISPESVDSGSYTLNELRIFQERFPNPSGHILPIMITPTSFDLIPNYLKAVTILNPVGNQVADCSHEVSKIASRRRRKKIKWLSSSTASILIAISVIYFSSRPADKQAELQMKTLKGFSMFAAPNTDSMIIQRVKADAEFTFLPDKRTANWALIKLESGQEGWVMAQDMNYVVSTVKKIDVGTGFGFRGSFWQLFFTSPQPDGNTKNEFGIDARFADAIDKCKTSLNIAIDALNNRLITDAIIEAKKRGVLVQIVTDDINLESENSTFKELIENGIKIRSDSDDIGIMFNRFAIFDQKVVWTGSWGYTNNSTYKHNENEIVFESPDIAAVYTEKFNKMFNKGIFSKQTRKAKVIDSLSSLKVDNPLPFNVEIYFAPDDNIIKVLLSKISNAKSSIRFMAFAFTLEELTNILKQKAQNGVIINGILEKRLTDSSRLSRLFTSSFNNFVVKLDGNKNFLHHKCIIIDDKIVITGSLNFSHAGTEINDANLIIIPDSTLATKYNAEFQRLWSVANKIDK